MRIYILILLTFVYGIIECYKLQEVPKFPINEINKSANIKRTNDHFSGAWKTHTEWKSYWMKEWIQKTVYVPKWKKVWAPVEISKWIPVPNGQKH